MAQERLLGEAGASQQLVQLLRCCLVVSAKGCCKETRGDLGRISEASCLNERAAVIGLATGVAVQGLQR